MTSRIKAAMDERGMSQAEVAAASGIAPTQLARMLRDPDHNYTLRTLQRIAAALGADLSVEFADPDQPREVSGGTYARLLTEDEARASVGMLPIKITKRRPSSCSATPSSTVSEMSSSPPARRPQRHDH